MGQELSRWGAETEQEMSKISLWEQQTGLKLQPVKDSSDKELSRGAEDGAQELSQQQDDVTCSTGDKPLGPGMQEGPQPCAPAGPGSPSPAGTAVAAEAAPALPCASPAPGRATGAEPAAAAPAGAAGQEEPPEPLAEQQEEKAPQSPVPSWELPSARALSRVPAPRSPPGRSMVLEVAWCLSREYMRPIPLEIQQPEGLWDLEQRLAVLMGETDTAEKEQSPVLDLLRPSRPSCTQLESIREQQEGSATWSEEGGNEETLDWDRSWDSCSDTDLSQGEYDTDTELSPEEEDEDLSQFGVTFSPEDRALSPEMEGDVVPQPCFSPASDTSSRWIRVIYNPLKIPLSPVMEEEEEEEEEELQPSSPESEHEAELSQGERNSCSPRVSQGEECAEQELSREVSDREECTEEEMSLREATSSQERSDWEEHLEKELSLGDIKSREEVSDWEEHVGTALSQQEVSLGQDVTPGNGHRPSVHSSWENDSDQELAQDPWEVGTESGSCLKPLAPEEDEWDELSVLELPLEEDKEQKQRAFAADGLPVPVPREAWVEGPAPEPCSLPSPWPAQLGAQALREQPAAPRKRPSRFRRALRAPRGLFRCPCLAAPPEE